MSEVFQRLVKTLSHEERRDLLKRLTASPESDSLAPPPEESEPDWEEVYQSYSLWKKFFLWLKKFFRATDLATVVQEQVLSDLATRLERQCPGFFHLRLKMALTPFYRELERLFSALAPFREPFRTAFGERKNEFVAFWIALEIPEWQEILNAVSDFATLESQHPERPIKEIKTIADGDFRGLLDSLPPERKKNLNESLKALSAFRALCHFPVDKLLSPFQLLSVNGQPTNALLTDLQDELIELAKRLDALKASVPESALEALFLFHNGDTFNSPEADVETPLAAFLDQAHDAWGAVRNFHQRVPLAKLCGWLLGNPSWVPLSSLAPVDEWVTLYRRFWQNRLDTSFEVFVRQRKVRIVVTDACRFLEMAPEEFGNDHFYPPLFPGRLPTRGEQTLQFLRLFLERIFVPKMNPTLKIVLLEGDFYKRHNRNTFTDCYNTLLQIPDQLTAFQRHFGPEGEWGQRESKANQQANRQAECQCNACVTSWEAPSPSRWARLRPLRTGLPLPGRSPAALPLPAERGWRALRKAFCAWVLPAPPGWRRCRRFVRAWRARSGASRKSPSPIYFSSWKIGADSGRSSSEEPPRSCPWPSSTAAPSPSSAKVVLRLLRCVCA